MASEKLKKALLAASQEEYLSIDKESETIEWNPSDDFMAEMEVLVKRHEAHRHKSLRRVLLVAAVVFLVSCITVFSFAEVRENVINQFKDYYRTHFDVEYGFEEPGDIVVGNGIRSVYTLSHVPEGFVQVTHEKNEHTVVTVWEKGEETLVLSQGDGITKRSIDAERLVKTQQVVNGTVYDIYSEEGYVLVLWNTQEYTFGVDYYGNAPLSEISDIVLSLEEVSA